MFAFITNMGLILPMTRFILPLTFFILALQLSAEPTKKEIAPSPLPIPSAKFSIQVADPADEIKKQVDQFFDLLKKDQVSSAFDGILANTKVKDRESEVTDLKSKTTTLLADFGKVLGYELYESKFYSSRYLVLSYISYSENYPIRWKLTYYKPQGVWRLIDIRADTRVEDAAK